MIVNGQFYNLGYSTHLIYDYLGNSYVYLYKILYLQVLIYDYEYEILLVMD